MEKLCMPTVAVIIENQDKTKILMQRRRKTTDQLYSGVMEIPGGRLRAFEHVVEGIKREVREETGLELTKIEGLITEPMKGPNGEQVIAFKPFCGEQILNGEQPWVGFVFIGKAKGKPRASKENEMPQWLSLEEVQKLIDRKEVFWYHAQVLQTYLNERKESGVHEQDKKEKN